MHRFSEKKIVAGSLLTLGILFSIIAAFTDCSAGGADNYAHFNIARWAFRYPHLFLDHWGKPLFTILIAPFTQLGFFGARLFNILGGLTTAWICYLLASGWKLPKAWLAPVFVIFVPIYFILMFSGMTEILFSLVLILAIFQFFREQFVLSAIVLSLIILVRTEGFIFMPIFFVAYVLKRKFVAIPFLLSGFLLFSLIGKLYYYNDFWWLINKLPYGSASNEIYGSGKWHHFLSTMPDYLGFGIILLFFAGTFFLVKDWVFQKFSINSDRFYQLLILGGCFFGFLASHSYVWWQGQMSLGLVRVMVGVTPIAGILALVGFERTEKLILSKNLKLGFLILSIVLIVIPGVMKYKSEFRTDPHSIVIQEAIKWLRETHNIHHHLIVHDPSIAFHAEIDAWDQRILQYGFSDVNAPEKEMPDSSVFIWDAHYSQNEGGIAASKILENPYYELIAYFEPEFPFKVLGGYDYNIMVFRKVKSSSVNNFQVLDNLKAKLSDLNFRYSEKFDFETSIPEKINDKFRTRSSDSTANFCYQMGNESDFSPCIQFTDNELKISNRLKFEVDFDFFLEEIFIKNELVMVFSVDENDKSYYYQGDDILPFFSVPNQWNHAKFSFSMPEVVKKNSTIKFYIWDIKKKKLKLDNFNVQVFSKKDI